MGRLLAREAARLLEEAWVREGRDDLVEHGAHDHPLEGRQEQVERVHEVRARGAMAEPVLRNIQGKGERRPPRLDALRLKRPPFEAPAMVAALRGFHP